MLHNLEQNESECQMKNCRPSYERTNTRSWWPDNADHSVLPNYVYVALHVAKTVVDYCTNNTNA
jgi:hypothetical protein